MEFLFEKHNVEKLVKIIQLLIYDTKLQDKLSKHARAKAFKRNFPPKVAEKYLEVYKSLVNGATSNITLYKHSKNNS